GIFLIAAGTRRTWPGHAWPARNGWAKQGILCFRFQASPQGVVSLAGAPFRDGWRRVLKVLKLSAQGLPQSWISLEQAVLHYAADQVRWEAGAEVAVFRGGHNASSGMQ